MFYLDTLSVFVAVGPFTTSESDSYEPYTDFLKQVSKEEPDLVIMVIYMYIVISTPYLYCRYTIFYFNKQLLLYFKKCKWKRLALQCPSHRKKLQTFHTPFPFHSTLNLTPPIMLSSFRWGRLLMQKMT